MQRIVKLVHTDFCNLQVKGWWNKYSGCYSFTWTANVVAEGQAVVLLGVGGVNVSDKTSYSMTIY